MEVHCIVCCGNHGGQQPTVTLCSNRFDVRACLDVTCLDTAARFHVLPGYIVPQWTCGRVRSTGSIRILARKGQRVVWCHFAVSRWSSAATGVALLLPKAICHSHACFRIAHVMDVTEDCAVVLPDHQDTLLVTVKGTVTT